MNASADAKIAQTMIISQMLAEGGRLHFSPVATESTVQASVTITIWIKVKATVS